MIAACSWTQRTPPLPDPSWRLALDEEPPDCVSRGTAEFETWVAANGGFRLADRPKAALGVAVGTEATFPLAFDDRLRLGPWLEVGADLLDLVRASGGVSIVLSGLLDPNLVVQRLASTQDEGAFELRLGAGWRSLGGLDHVSDGPQLEAKLVFGTRRYTEWVSPGNAFRICDGTSQDTRFDERVDLGHWGFGYAYGHRLFVELERSLDGSVTQLMFGVEIDPVTMWEEAR